MQLLSNKSATGSTKESKKLDEYIGTDEKEWEGFGEGESEKHVDALRSKGKIPVGKDTRKSEKKLQKQDEKQKKRAASQPKASTNTFEALGTADEGEDVADDEIESK